MTNRKLFAAMLAMALVLGMTACGKGSKVDGKTAESGKTADSSKTAESKTSGSGTTASDSKSGGTGGWILVKDSAFGPFDIRAIAFGNNKFVAGGESGKMAYSSDGITWTAVKDSTFNSSIWAIAWGKDKFVAGDQFGKMAYSSDGITWTAGVSAKIGSAYAIAWGKDKFVVGGGGGGIAYSSDGVSWTAVKDSTFGLFAILGIAYGKDKFIAVGQRGKIATSTDGVTWTAVDTGTAFDAVNNSGETVPAGIGTIAFGKDKFVAGGGSGKMAISK
jgi:hypothetical protein